MVQEKGWYTDWQDSSRLRWWDGDQWSEHVRENRPESNPPQEGSGDSPGGLQGSKQGGDGYVHGEAGSGMATTGDQIKRPESSLPKKTWAQPGATAGLGRQTGAMARERLSLRTAERVVKLVFVPYLITSFVGGILILGLVLAAGHVMSADAPTYELTYEPSYEPTSAFYSFGMSGIGGAIIAFVIQAAAIYVASWFAMVGCAMVTKAAWGVAPRPFEMGVRAAYGAFVVVVFFIFASTAGMLLSLFVEFLISIGLAELGRTGILIGLGISLIGGLLIFVIASAGVVYSFVGFIKEVGAQAQLRQ